MSQHRHGRARALVAIGLAAGLALITIAPTSAAIYLRERYHETDAFSYDDCGGVVNVDVEFGGLFQIRTGRGNDASAFFAHDNYWFRETHVRESDGKTYVISGNGNFKETRASRIDGDVFEFTAIDTGRLFTIRDSDGNVIVRDRGNYVETIEFDTLGDDMPGGELVVFVGFEEHGKFPGASFDFCSLWAD